MQQGFAAITKRLSDRGVLAGTGHNTPLGHHTGHGPIGLGQYDGPGEYCGPHTASSMFLISIYQLSPDGSTCVSPIPGEDSGLQKGALHVKERTCIHIWEHIWEKGPIGN